MKKITLRDDLEIKSRDIIKIVMESAPPNKGLTPADMRGRIKVLDILEISKKKLSLENEQWNLLKEAFTIYQFRGVHKDIILITDDIENAEDVDIIDKLKKQNGIHSRKKK